jgi:hypothetical protein
VDLLYLGTLRLLTLTEVISDHLVRIHIDEMGEGRERLRDLLVVREGSEIITAEGLDLGDVQFGLPREVVRAEIAGLHGLPQLAPETLHGSPPQAAPGS